MFNINDNTIFMPLDEIGRGCSVVPFPPPLHQCDPDIVLVEGYYLASLLK